MTGAKAFLDRQFWIAVKVKSILRGLGVSDDRIIKISDDEVLVIAGRLFVDGGGARASDRRRHQQEHRPRLAVQ